MINPGTGLLNTNIDYSKILNPTIINKDITPSSAISQVLEYFRYSVIGNICIVDIGGIVFNSAGTQYATEGGLPIAKTRPVGILTTNTASTGEPGITTTIYGRIGEGSLRVQVTSEYVGNSLYGQVIYLI